MIGIIFIPMHGGGGGGSGALALVVIGGIVGVYLLMSFLAGMMMRDRTLSEHLRATAADAWDLIKDLAYRLTH